MVIECEEKRFQVEFREVLSAVKQRDRRVVVRLTHCARMLGIDHLLILGRGHVGERCIQQRQHMRRSVFFLIFPLGGITVELRLIFA